MRYQVKVLRRADRDVDEILHYIGVEQSSPTGARRWYQAYAAALERLAVSANTLSLAPENEFVNYEVRQVLFRTRRGRPYRGIFTIVGDEVRLLHVRGPGQDILQADEIAPRDERHG